jgi:hypothetical protein
MLVADGRRMEDTRASGMELSGLDDSSIAATA